MTRLTYMTALALGAAAVGCNCGYQSWRRGPACASPAVSNCTPNMGYGTPYEATIVEQGVPAGATPQPTLRTTPGGPIPTPGQ